jgi:branched-subunit amino acid ABC-type transport system permease component
MNSNNILLWFLIIGGFLTAGVGVIYFLSGESGHASDGQNYSVFVQILLGGLVTIYGTRKYCEEPVSRRD